MHTTSNMYIFTVVSINLDTRTVYEHHKSTVYAFNGHVSPDGYWTLPRTYLQVT